MELEEEAAVAHEVVGHLEVLLALARDAADRAFVLLHEPFFDDGLHPALQVCGYQ